MNKLVIKIVILFCFPTMIYSQTNYSKEEIYKLWTKITNQTKTQFDYKFHFNPVVINFIDSLKDSGIDTIGAYGEQYVGAYTLDSCKCGMTPWMTVVQWIDNGQTFHRLMTECCHFKTKKINNSVMIRYYANCKSQIDHEWILPNITSVSKDKNGEILLTFSMIDHTTHYSIYCDLNNHTRFLTFEMYDFVNKESIFYYDNNNSIIKSWRDMIISQIKEIN
ncbi:MAG: hypothetical protein GYA51_03745 [Candidatus Methanofastidiosa archaeon]|nr:hypothetical protein [Candidatus Methanofastidiosa archaeon]